MPKERYVIDVRALVEPSSASARMSERMARYLSARILRVRRIGD
jgi:hypothetical protein